MTIKTNRGRLGPYPRYKDSGVEWLGEIPAGWEVKPLRTTIRSCQNGVWGDDPDGVRDVVCVRVADFDRIRLGVALMKPTMRAVEPRVVAERGLRSGDLLLEKSGGGENQPVGAVVLYRSEGPAVCSNFVARVVVASASDPEYLVYLHKTLYAMRINTRHIKQSTGIQNLDDRSYFSEAIALPSAFEQRAIATFLDRETARIDALVAKKERLIALLQERRTALIRRAVTKGLDPDAPMKDSGVEWLGEIPAHWEVRRLKHVGCMRAGTAITSESIEAEADFPVYGGNGIRGYTREYSYAGSFPLIGRQGALCGCVTLATGTFWASEHAIVVRPAAGTDAEWLTSVLSSMDLNQYSVSAAQPGLAVDNIGVLETAFPPLPEQRSIASFLKRGTSHIDALTTRIRTAITHLHELRTALISAAVTGKIDVREAGQ